MRTLSIFFLVIFFLSGCRKEDEEVIESCISETIVDQLIQTEGIVQVIGNIWVIEVNSNDRSGRYFACNFPEDLKIENHLIIFDANVYEIPPNMRLAGIPIIVTRIY